MNKSGSLYVVATPIGNLDDISPRAIKILSSVDIIAAEDTRHSRRLLNRHKISAVLTSYHEHNELAKSQALVRELEAGKSIALITDAGTPCISDPGFRIVREARARDIVVHPIPGPSALVAALSASGLPSDRFFFHGFFPRKATLITASLQRMEAEGGTHIFFESPARLLATLKTLASELTSCEVCVARELTKVHEEIVTGQPAVLHDHLALGKVKGECVLIVHIAPASEPRTVSLDQIHAALNRHLDAGLSRSDAVRQAATELGLPRNTVYKASLDQP